ncbi:MAG: carboxypeptidase regulatory-like domain-containing protein [Thermoanaerobaculia bacterium]
MIRKILPFALLLAVAAPLFAGDVHGHVAAKGVRDSADAVVYLAAVPGKTFPAPAEHGKIDQQNLVFHPHVLPVQVGATVDFLNSDAVLHNVFSPDACADKFNLGTWPKGQTKSFTFKKECVATLLCKVHPEMEAFVVAVPTPYFAVTKADGSYTIAGVPDGSYTVKVWHPKLKGAEKAVKVAGATQADFEVHK